MTTPATIPDSPGNPRHRPGAARPRAGDFGASRRLGIVCPVANEQATLEAFVKEVLAVCDGFSFSSVLLFLIVDEVSTDDTPDICRSLDAAMAPVRCVWAPDNRSVAAAYLRGYREAIAAECDWILEMDAGFSHQPRDIGQFIELMAAGKDCVFGSRFMHGACFDGAAWKRRLVSQGGTWLVNLALGTKMTDMTSGFECFTRRALQEILAARIHSRGTFFQTEIRVHAHRLDYAEAPIHYQAPLPHVRTVRKGAIRESLRQLWRLFRAKRRAS